VISNIRQWWETRTNGQYQGGWGEERRFVGFSYRSTELSRLQWYHRTGKVETLERDRCSLGGGGIWVEGNPKELRKFRLRQEQAKRKARETVERAKKEQWRKGMVTRGGQRGG